MNILLQILDEGKVTDAHGRTVSFENTVIAMTSNAGSSFNTSGLGFAKSEADISKDKAMKALGEFLRPEFLSRVDEVVVFKPLTLDAYKGIAGLMIGEMKEPLLEKNITLNVSDEAYELVAKKASGGKFGGSGYKVSGGLHGVGVSVVNALSSKVVAQVKRDGAIWEMEFSRGKTVQKIIEVGKTEKTGTTITFWPDPEIFQTVEFDYETLRIHFRQTAFLNKGLKIVFCDDRGEEPQTEVFQYKGGIIDFVGYMNEGKAITLERILQYGKDAENADFLLFHLGWDKRWGTDAYFGDYPCLDDAAMDYIIAGDYKGIGFDVIGLDPIADENLTRHKKLFQNKDIVNIENLKDLDKCGKGLFSFSCFPLKLENCDGSPIRAVAWFED